MRTRFHCQGYMLVECMIYIAILAIVLTIAFGAFYRSLASSRTLARNTADILRTLRAGESWRADVREAVAPLNLVSQNGVTGCEIRASDRLMAYLYDGTNVWRLTGDEPPQLILAQVRSSQIIQDKRSEVTVWRWEVELQTKRKSARLQPLFTFQGVAVRQTNAHSKL